ncbi:unnamed protein product, partial [Mesorhabditis belari]|uniref:F-box domain-containing protein n=1 Tax=Mesorhabditis belari TaxID=2138241 RepID=A0AAF3FH37_9BILA
MNPPTLASPFILEIAKHLPIVEAIDKIRFLNTELFNRISKNLRNFRECRGRVAYLQQVELTYVDQNEDLITVGLKKFLEENEENEDSIVLFEVLAIDASLTQSALTKRFLSNTCVDVALLVWTNDTFDGFIRRPLYAPHDPSIPMDPLEAYLAAQSAKSNRLETIEKGTQVATWIGQFLRRPRLYGFLIACVDRLQYFALPTSIRMNYSQLPTTFTENMKIRPKIDSVGKFAGLLEAYQDRQIVHYAENLSFVCSHEVVAEIWNRQILAEDAIFQKEILSPDSIQLTWAKSSLKLPEELNQEFEQLNPFDPIDVTIEGCEERGDKNYHLLQKIFQEYL